LHCRFENGDGDWFVPFRFASSQLSMV